MAFFNSLRFRSKRNATNGNAVYQSNSQNSSTASLPSRRSSTAVPGSSAAALGSHSVAKKQTMGTPQQMPLFMQNPYVRAALVKGSFQTIVELPKHVDPNEWLALNIFEFNSYLTQFCSMLSEFITPEQCPTMSAGPGYDYLWIDANKQAVRLPASTYIEYTLSWISSMFDDQTLFPTRQGAAFNPDALRAAVTSIYVQLFRIFAHIYHNHFDKIVHLSLEPHWNSFFCHFYSFGKTFELIHKTDKTEVAPLLPLIQSFEAQGKIA